MRSDARKRIADATVETELGTYHQGWTDALAWVLEVLEDEARAASA